MSVASFAPLSLIEWLMPFVRKLRVSRHAAEAINSVNAGYWVLDAEGKFLDVNDAYCRMVGYSRNQIMGMQISDFEAVATQEEIMGQIRRILANGQEQFTTRHCRSNGSWLDLEVTVTPINQRELVVYLRDISDAKRAAFEINQLAFYDSLTGLPNRRLLHDRIEQALINSARYKDYGALLFIDLDQFKVLNDAHGHAKGDCLLIEVSQRLLAITKAGDTVSRFGGDEFVLIQLGLGTDATAAIEAAREKARQVLTCLADSHRLDGIDYSSTASIGITLFCNEQRTAGDLLKHADLAMYHAKIAGRNTYQFFDEKMQTAIDKRNVIEASLRTALKSQQLFLHYQPQVDRDKYVIGAEALVRWSHPLHGLIPPNEFIQIAEESGLILELGQWILETACAQLSAWGQHYKLCNLTMAVNVSAPQIHDPNFVTRVIDTLQRTGADPKLLKLEITESVLLSNVEDVIAKMNLLRNHGVRFALDDFGTGYCSLTYLSRLPVSELKIDRSFVNSIDFSESAILICVSVLGLAHSLRVKVVAEGVETENQFEFLTADHSCDYVQGYLISKPLTDSDFASYASNHTRH